MTTTSTGDGEFSAVVGTYSISDDIVIAHNVTYDDHINITGTLTVNASKTFGEGAAGKNMTVSGAVQVNGTLDLDRSSSDGNASFGSLTIGNGGTVQAPSHGNLTLTTDATDQFLYETISGATFSNNDGNVIITGDGKLKPRAGTGNFHNLTINASGNTIDQSIALTCEGNLTITAGTLDTDSSSNFALTVTGKTTIGDASHGSEDQATLTCNASAISLGSGKTDDYAIIMLAGGTFAGGSANHTTGAIKQSVANTKFTFTSATTTINSEYTSEDRMFTLTNGKSYNSDGRITLQGNFTSYIQWDTTAGDNGPHNLRINDASLTAKQRTDLTVEGYLKVDAGTFTTLYGASTSQDLTVTGDIDITGTLTGNASAISAGGLRVNSGGLYTATSGVTSITGELSSHAFRISGGGTLANSNGTITFLNVNSRLTMNGTGNIHHLILNHASCFIMLQSDGTTTVEGNLTITAGQLTTLAEGTSTSKNLTVTGDASITGTLTGNASAISMGSVTIESGGTYSATNGTTTIEWKWQEQVMFII